MERDNSVDIAKGIGIFLVIWAHTVCPLIPQISLFHMPLFFMLSGFVFSNKDGFRIILGKKIKSLLIPFLIFFVFQRIGFILISIAGGTFEKGYLLPWHIIPPWRVMGVLWFLGALFTVTMLYSLISMIGNDLLKILISLALTFSGYLLSRHDIHLPMHLGSSLSMMFFFCLGNIFAGINLFRTVPAGRLILPGILLLVVFVVSVNIYLPTVSVANNTLDGNFFLILTLMVLGCLMIFLNSKSLTLVPGINTALAYTGRNSLTIYVTHTVILEAIYLVFPKNTLSFTGGVLISIFILLAGLIINLFLQKYFQFALGKQDLIPGRWLLKGLTQKR